MWRNGSEARSRPASRSPSSVDSWRRATWRPTSSSTTSTKSGLRTVRLGDTKGFVRVLNVVNSIDTPVCDVQTKKLDWQLDGARLLTVSMDLPFAEARWAREACVRHPAVSSHRSEAFGRDYGVLIKEWRALQRSIFVIDGAGHVRYVEYVVDQDAEPDYNAVVDAVMDAIVTTETANCASDHEGGCC